MLELVPKAALVVVISCGLAACGSSGVKRPEPSPDVPFTLAIGQTAAIAGTDLSVTFVDVLSDSRCPADVQCVWAGEATIRLNVTRGGNAKTVELSDGASSAVEDGYRISFEELAPATHSKKTIPKSEYRATIRVARAGGATS